MNKLRSRLTSVRGKSLIGFVIIILLVLGMVTASIYQLALVRAASAEVIPGTEQIEYVQEIATSMSVLEANLDSFFVTGGADFEERIRDELSFMRDILTTLQAIPNEETEETTRQLSRATEKLEQEMIVFLETNRNSWTPNELNRALIRLYEQIDEVNRLQQQLSNETLADLRAVSRTQQSIIDNINTQFIILSVLVLLISTIAAVVVARTLRPISTLTEVSLDIAGGNLERVAPVESNDEFGTLAQAFNQMTEQLRDLVFNLEQRVAARTRDLELANEIGYNMSEIRDPNQLLTDAVQAIQQEFDLYLAQIYLIEEGGETILLRAAEGQSSERLLAQEHFLAISIASINGTAVSEARPVVVSDTTHDPRFRPNPLLPETRSEMAVPLLVSNKAIGSLDLQSNIPNFFTEENVPAFTAIAGQLAVALDNGALFSERMETADALEEALTNTALQAKRLAALNEMSASFGITEELHEVFNLVSHQILVLMEGSRLSITKVTEDGKSFEVQSLEDKTDSKLARKLPVEGTAVGLAIKEKRAIHLPKEAPLSTYMDSRMLAGQGIKSILSTPLIVSGKIWGAINIASQKEYAFTEADISFIQQIASLLASTIESKDLTERVQRLAGIVENHPDFIGIASLDGRTIYANPAGLALIGMPLDFDILDMQAADFYIEEDATRLVEESFPMALETGSWTGQMMLRRTDGTTLPVEQTVAVNYNAENRANSFSVTMRDITVRHEAVEQQRRLTTQLEERLLQVNAIQRAMTHEGWSAFLTSDKRLVQGFKFNDEQMNLISARDLQQGNIPLVMPSVDANKQLDTMAASIDIRGETVGAIGARNVDGTPLTEEQTAILNAMTRQVADALDRARLFEEMELAREQMNALYSGSERVIRAKSMDDVLLALIESTSLRRMDSATFLFFNRPWRETPPETMMITAVWQKREGLTPEKVGDVYEIETFPSLLSLNKDKPTIFYDVKTDERAGADAKMLAERLGVNCVMYFPLIVGDQWFGMFSAKAKNTVKLSADELKQITGLVDQTSTVTQTQRLFEQTQSRARREQLLREVSEKVYAAPDAESILKTAVKEVNRIMGKDSFIYLDDQLPKQDTTRNGTPLATEETAPQEG